MFLLENIKISHKLIAFASLTLASLFIIAFLSVVKMQIALSAIPELTHSITFVDDARHAEAIFKELRISAIKVPMTISKEQLDSFKKAYKTNRGHFNELLDRMINNNTCSGYKECLNVINVMSEKLHDYDKAKDEVIRLTEEDKRVDAFLAVERLLVPIGDDIDKNVNKIISIASDLSDTSVNKVYDRCNPFILYVVAIFTFTILTITIYFIGRSIIIPIQKLSRDSKIIASGDLTVEVDTSMDQDNEIGRLSHAFADMVDTLRSILLEINNNSVNLSKTADELNHRSNEVSDSNEEILKQALAITNASTEIANTSKDISLNCSKASELSSETQKIVKTDVEKIKAILDKIREYNEFNNDNFTLIKSLGEHTKKISGILETIQEIAEQTNLLALNAAIEAARAGEHGRGFAVVADEIRSLASRTSSSTKEISLMINSIHEVEKKTTASMVDNLKKMNLIAEDSEEIENGLNEINSSVETVHHQITMIASATEQQTATSYEMTNKLELISDTTRNASAEAKRSLEISNLVEKMSGNMLENINHFRL